MSPMKYDIEGSLGSIVRRAERALINRLNQHFKRNGFHITTEQYRVLVNLWNKDGQNQQEIAESTLKNKATVTRLINGLEKRDLVVRIHDKTDHRNKRVCLTDKGKKLPEALSGLAKKTLKEAEAGIPEDEIEVCKNVLRRVIQNIR